MKVCFKPESWERGGDGPHPWCRHSHCTDFGFYSEGKIHCVLSREVRDLKFCVKSLTLGAGVRSDCGER